MRMVTDFAKAGATNNQFSPEATPAHVDRTIQPLLGFGLQARLGY